MRTVAALACLLAPMGLGACGGSSNCPESCPASKNYITASILIAFPSSMGLEGVQATLAGPVTDTMSCQPYGMASVCTWSDTAPITAGTYSLQVSAPGYRPTDFQVTVIVPSCECVGASIQPANVSVSPSDAGLD
jgi:hypothetical protein